MRITIAAMDWPIGPPSEKPSGKILCEVNSNATRTEDVAKRAVNTARIPLHAHTMFSFAAISFGEDSLLAISTLGCSHSQQKMEVIYEWPIA
jgi:hypothetical protein